VDRLTDEGFEGGLFYNFSFLDVDGSSRVAVEAKRNGLPIAQDTQCRSVTRKPKR